MVSQDTLAITAALQESCAAAYVDVMQSLRVGMSEQDVAEALHTQLGSMGIRDYWYDVPCNVLIGARRFREGTTTTDYRVKAPSAKVRLSRGDPVFVDLSPMDGTTGRWGDWASTCVYSPQTDAHAAQLEFLRRMWSLHRRGIGRINSSTTGAQVASYYRTEYTVRGITLLDVRNNVGHSVHQGPKSEAERIWLDAANTAPLGTGIFTVEPGCMDRRGRVARFEECVHIPAVGRAAIIGAHKPVPLVF